MIERPQRYRDEAYLDEIRASTCCVDWRHGGAEPHHLDRGGTGTKGSDLLTVPLCRSCHDELHVLGMVRWCERHGMPQWFLWERAARLLADVARKRGQK